MSHTALITGASSGIGREMARVFASKGHNLLITARREKRLKELKEELESRNGVTVHVLAADLTDEDTPNTLYRFAKERDLAVNMLVNNAGVGDYGFFHESEWNRQETMIDLNIKALIRLTHLFLPDMVEMDRAYVMNVASNAAFQPGPLMSIYYASKHFVLAFSQAIANELQDTCVSVTALCPGLTESEFQQTAGILQTRLVNRFPTPASAEVAEYGYKAMMKGKRVAIHGTMNKIGTIVVKFLPKKLVLWAVRWIQSAE